ncbi:MAG: hypothetical protein PUC47_10360, partial [Oscillospiraceae bacterium]|nr:hypothetical protein [Oscillospiraceae bacterium]
MMKKTFKRILSLALSAVCALGLTGTPAAASAGGKISPGWSWSVQDRTLYLSGSGGMHHWDMDYTDSEFWREVGAVCDTVSLNFTDGRKDNGLSPYRIRDRFSVFTGSWGSLTWRLDQTTSSLTISGSGPMPEENAPWTFFGSLELFRHVIIEDGVTTVSAAFVQSAACETVTLGSTADLSKACPVATTAYYVSGKNPRYLSYCGMLYSKDGSTLIRCPRDNQSGVYHQNLKVLGDNAFTKREKLVVPQGVTTIGKDALGFPSVLVLPDSVTSIDPSNNQYGRYCSLRLICSKKNTAAQKAFPTRNGDYYTVTHQLVDSVSSYYTGRPGVPKYGWVKENGSWYFYEADQRITETRRIDGRDWTFDAAGKRLEQPPVRTEKPPLPCNTGGLLLGQTPQSGKGYQWEPGKKLLTLSSGARLGSIQFEETVTGTVTVQLKGSVTLSPVYGQGVLSALAAEKAGLVIRGGSLKITGSGNAGGQDVYGIRSGLGQDITLDGVRLTLNTARVTGAGYHGGLCSGGNLTVRGGSLSVTTGDGSKCTAIRALSSFDFPSGTITAASGSSAANPLDSGSYGLYICGESRIGGQLTAAGGDAPTRSHTYPMSAGIYTVGSLEITGSVRATSSTGYDAYGMYIVGDLTIGKTGSLTAKNGSRTPTNTASGISIHSGGLTLNGGTVRAESGATVQLSAGVFFDTVTITINSGR